MITDRKTVCGPFESSKSSSLAQSHPATKASGHSIIPFLFIFTTRLRTMNAEKKKILCISHAVVYQPKCSGICIWISTKYTRASSTFQNIVSINSKNCENFDLFTEHRIKMKLTSNNWNVIFSFFSSSSDVRCKLQFNHRFVCGSVHLMKYVSRYIHKSLKLNWNCV